MGLLRKCPLSLRKHMDEHEGARALRQIAVLLLLVTAAGWICGWISPLILAPAYIITACCMYMRLRHVRLMMAAVMLVHLAFTLLQCVLNVPVWVTHDFALRFKTAMQMLYCICYLAVVMYLYISPSIAEYYQERRN